ncbi:hypothetical protein NKH77_51525 [Streptomyces sp. M19]
MTQLGPTALNSLVIPALGAALIAGFRRFWVALAVAFGAGIAESLAVGYSLPSGLGRSIPYLVTLLALVVAGRGLPDAARSTRRGCSASAAAVCTRRGSPRSWPSSRSPRCR